MTLPYIHLSLAEQREIAARGMDIASLPEEVLLEIYDRLNVTPRKCLGYRTP